LEIFIIVFEDLGEDPEVVIEDLSEDPEVVIEDLFSTVEVSVGTDQYCVSTAVCLGC
jgi:hypothetical protein